MKVLIVDDEPLARARLLALLKDHEQITALEEAVNGIEALQKQQTFQPDVVLLDIRMPGMDGLEAASHLAQLESPPVVVFTTAYDEHALEAFDLQAIGYLVKPVKKERLLQTLETANRLTRAQLNEIAGPARQYISAQVAGNLQVVPIEDVYYFRADQKYVEACHGNGTLLLEETLKHLEAEFAQQFIRIHRSALVALDRIAAIQKNADGQMVVRLHDLEEELEISRRHLPEVRKAIKEMTA
jgi:two-component system response regulator AlgR